MSAPEHLLPLARTFGVSTDGRTVPFVHRGLACRISLDYSSGMVVGLEGHVRTQPLPDVGFRAEATIDPIVAHEIEQGDDGPYLSVDMQTPDEPGETFSVSLPNGPLPGPKSSLVLNVYPGALGWPWHDRFWVVGVR